MKGVSDRERERGKKVEGINSGIAGVCMCERHRLKCILGGDYMAYLQVWKSSQHLIKCQQCVMI